MLISKHSSFILSPLPAPHPPTVDPPFLNTHAMNIHENEPFQRSNLFPKETGAMLGAHVAYPDAALAWTPVPRNRGANVLTPSSVNYAALGSAWFSVVLRLFGLVVLGVIGYTMYQWEMSHYEYCSAAAVSEHKEAMSVRASHCEDQLVTQAVRASRAVTAQCIDAARTIIDGHNIYKWNCFISKHMIGAGSCSTYPACAYMVEWIETLREDIYVIAIFGTFFLAYKMVTSTGVATSQVMSRALEVTSAYRRKESGIIGHGELSPVGE